MIGLVIVVVIVGIYLIEIVFILSSTLVTVKAGRDPLMATAQTGKNLKVTMILYTIVAIISVVLLTVIGAVALSNLT